MTRTVSLIQLGIGHVGAAVMELVVKQAARWRDDYDIAVRYAALADSTALVVAPDDMAADDGPLAPALAGALRSEEHTSELQSHVNLVCRLLLEKKNTRAAP